MAMASNLEASICHLMYLSSVDSVDLPRSAHIAGLPAAHATAEHLEEATLLLSMRCFSFYA